MDDQKRKEVIDECVRHLKQVQADFITMAPDMDEEDRTEAYSMAHIYGMAADELYNLDAEEVAKHERNIVKVKDWLKRLRAGLPAPSPDVEQRGPTEH